MNYPLIAILSLTVLILGACALAPKRGVVTETHINASPEHVWAVLSDTQAYPEWNPFITAMEGELTVGARLTNTMQPGPDQQMVFKPKLLVVDPNRELRWIGRLIIPGLFDGEHYFQLSPAGEGTRLVHGEKFSGLGLWFIDVTQFQPNFEDLNTALAARVAELETGTDEDLQ